MTSPIQAREAQDTVPTPVARIEAQDVEMIHPLREYLEFNGCRVVINRETSEDLTYVIAIGDVDFVKRFFERQYFRDTKKLAVVYDGTEEHVSSIASQKIQFFFIDAVPISPNLAQAIFSFFFTSPEQFKSNRKGQGTSTSKSVITKQASREPHKSVSGIGIESDKRRIAETMRQVFQAGIHTKKEKRKHNQIVAWLCISLAAFIAPFVAYTATVVIGLTLLVLGGKTLVQTNSIHTESLISIGSTYVQSARSLIGIASPIFTVLGKQEFLEDQDRFLSIMSDLALAETNAITILSNSKTIAGGILAPNDNSENIGVSDVINLTTDVHRVSQLLSLINAELQALLDSSRFPFSIPQVKNALLQGENELRRIRNVIGYTEKMLTIYPRIGGFRKKQTYLVLLQNSMELRPTGGFIGSVMLISFIDGKVDAMEVQDVYTADGQLRGHVDPPTPIKEILGQEHWYLRDSNWDPDFTISGKQAAWFYEKELGVHPDGVIALTLPMVTQLLRITGPVELLDFNERISEGNFYAKSLLYTNTDFFPGSTQKKDFLGGLTSALLTRLTTDRSISSGKLLNVITESVLSKDLQFYFTDPELEALVTQWKWTGDISVSDCIPPTLETSCIGDGIGIVRANLGVNKLDYFMRSEALSHITMSDTGMLDHTLTYSIENTSTLAPNEGGVYQGYFRFLIPKGSSLASLTLDGQSVPLRVMTNPVPPQPPYSIFEEQDRVGIIHIPFPVQPGEKRQVVLHVTRQLTDPIKDMVAYQFRIRKQPGVERTPWHVNISYPQHWIALSSDGVANQGELRYNTDLTNDEEYTVIFEKQL